MSRGRVLLLGADGFIGRHIGFALQQAGYDVLACARRPERLARMGFETLKADLRNPVTHKPSFWADHLRDAVGVVNAAGLLTGSDVRFQAVHCDAPQAVYAGMPEGCRAVLISAVGIDEADTAFARYRRAGEAIAAEHNAEILRPGLVLGDTSYGGSSLLRGLAACPLRTPVVGDGVQPFNPIHADDLATMVLHLLTLDSEPQTRVAGGPECVDQTQMIQAYRTWFGLPEVPVLRIPIAFANLLGQVGDVMRLGPISATAVSQLNAGVYAPHDPSLPPARPFSEFHRARPAGTQDLWHARLYLLLPIVRLTLALLWLASGLLGLLLPPDSFLPLIDANLPDAALIALARAGGLADLTIALALLRGWRLRLMAGVQLAMVAGYTLTFTFLAPGLWLLPLGGLLKNLPILILLVLHLVLEDER
ncbi:MAG: DoxX-like family protein [Paracoccaceae bacterium]